ncbi:helix-turn-helix domain-containing protein, partial [Streptomyces netropsis]|uniref:helix-turn-helix domain-containing protein n=1 Tax=Streptomyces netropsis TaxID=55404 RepID=UPI0037AC9E31
PEQHPQLVRHQPLSQIRHARFNDRSSHKKRCLSQRSLASALGIAQARWSRIERGQSTLDEHHVPLAAKLLGVSEGQLRSAMAAARRTTARS